MTNEKREFKGQHALANPNRRMWVNMPNNLDFVLIHVPEEEEVYSFDLEHEKGWTPTLLLYIAMGRTKRRSVTLDLTALTREEIDILGEFLSKSIEYAREYATERDKRVLEAHHAGTADVLFPRLYRRVPHLVDRSWEVLEHREGVSERSESSAGDDDVDPDE